MCSKAIRRLSACKYFSSISAKRSGINKILNQLLVIVCLSLAGCNDYTGYELVRLYLTSAASINNNGVALINQGVKINRFSGAFTVSEGRYHKITPPGMKAVRGIAINDNNDVLVAGYAGTDYKSFVCSSDICDELPVPQEWEWIAPQNLNNRGKVVGWGVVDYNQTAGAFIYDNGTYEKLPVACSYNSSNYYIFINDNDEVVFSYSCNLQDRTFLYKDGEYTELLVPGLTAFYALGISNNGAVLLYAIDITIQRARSFVCSDGQYTELLPPGLQTAIAWRINDNGTVLGSGYDSTGAMKWYLYDGKQYSVRTPPGILKNKDWVSIFGFNNSGIVVGDSTKLFFDNPYLPRTTGFIAVPNFTMPESNKVN